MFHIKYHGELLLPKFQIKKNFGYQVNESKKDLTKST